MSEARSGFFRLRQSVRAKTLEQFAAHLALLDPFQQRANIPPRRVWEFIR